MSTDKFWWHLENSNKEVFQAMELSLFKNLRHLIKPWMRGEIITENVMRSISDDSGISYPTVFDEFVYSCMHMKFVSNEIPQLVRKLQNQGKKVLIATDNMDSFNRWT